MKRYAMIGLLVVFLAGCVSMGTKVDEGQLRQFERGRSTYYDVVSRLGPPTQMTLHDDGSREVQYVYSQQQMRPESYIPFVAPFVQGATTESTSVLMQFDPQDVLITYTSTVGQNKVGTGFLSGAKQ